MTDYAARRTMMVDTQVRPADVTKFPIIDAMLSVPREAFVPRALREAAYVGENVDLGGGRVVLEPRTLAKMLDALDIRGDELVLDIGSALGYSSAVIARMAEAVVAVEEDEAHGAEAQSLLLEHGADNVVVHSAPLADGAAEYGPYDAIVIQGAVEQVPAALLDQLKDGGRIACLFIEGALGAVRIGYKSGGRMTWRFAFNAGAPVLPGFRKKAAFTL
jgi:protein-L-isoaspartate(D-aspartate) O-methyltransferase